eukprot:XP_003977201.1 PREDICTED: tetraspanin-8-like [Takifugu rubripes]
MAQINACLKRVFIVFNIFFAVVGAVILGLTLLSQVVISSHGGDQVAGRTAGLIILYIMGSVTMVIAILGAYGAHKENRVCLIVFLVCMVIGSLITLRTGIPAVIARSQIEGLLREKFSELVPLDKAPSDVRVMADELQKELHCCGLFSYKDWEGEIPDSCLCRDDTESECQQISYRMILMSESIYSKPCFPIIVYFVLLVADIMLAVIFSLAVLAILGVTLSSIMIHQMRYPARAHAVLTVPAIFTTAPPKYQELQSAPLY